MIICICKNISDKKIIAAIEQHPQTHTLKDLQKHLDVCRQCGKCKSQVISLIQNPNLSKI